MDVTRPNRTSIEYQEVVKYLFYIGNDTETSRNVLYNIRYSSPPPVLSMACPSDRDSRARRDGHACPTDRNTDAPRDEIQRTTGRAFLMGGVTLFRLQ